MPIAHKFSYFSAIHIETFIVSIVLCTILFFIPKIFKNINLKYYNIFKKKGSHFDLSIFLGILAIVSKIVDSIFRVVSEHEPVYNVFLIHLCNFAVLFAGLYLIFRTAYLFNTAYFLSFGAVLALLLPGVTVYYRPLYVHIFMFGHALIVLTPIIGFVYNKDKITKKGYIQASITLIGLFIYAAIYNLFFPVNAMFLRTHIISQVSFIKPIWLYDIVLILTMIFLQFLLYLPTKKENK